MEKSDIEEWKTVKSKGLDWIVSTSGRVRAPPHSTSYKRIRNGIEQVFSCSFKERDISACLCSQGYKEVAVSISGKRIKERVHRLVALAFCDGYSSGMTVNHIDGNKLNNAPENLEWISLSDNTKHEWATDLVDVYGENSPRSKLTTRQVLCIRRLLAAGVAPNALAVVAGVSPSLIGFIRDGKRWSVALERAGDDS